MDSDADTDTPLPNSRHTHTHTHKTTYTQIKIHKKAPKEEVEVNKLTVQGQVGHPYKHKAK